MKCVVLRAVLCCAVLAQYLEATGQHDPIGKIYVTCEPQPHIALWLSTLVFAYLPKFNYDRDFGNLDS